MRVRADQPTGHLRPIPWESRRPPAFLQLLTAREVLPTWATRESFVQETNGCANHIKTTARERHMTPSQTSSSRNMKQGIISFNWRDSLM